MLETRRGGHRKKRAGRTGLPMTLGATLRKWTSRLADRARRPTMGMVLGAHSCRCIASGYGGQILCEPSILWRRKDSKKILLDERSIGAVAAETLICRAIGDCEFVHPIRDGSTLDPYTLTCILRYFRKGLSRAVGCASPRYLIATGRPPLPGILRPILDRSAREAGFHGSETVEEHLCLAAGQPRSESPKVTVFVDIGEVGTRACVSRDGEFVRGSFVTSEIGGEQMLQSIVRAIREHRDLEVGHLMARRLLHWANDVSAWPFEVRGLDRSRGRPRSLRLEREEVLAVLPPLFEGISNTCHEALLCAGAAAGDDSEIVLAGGASRSVGLSEMLESRLQRRVRLEAAPEELSVRGLARLIAARSRGRI